MIKGRRDGINTFKRIRSKGVTPGVTRSWIISHPTICTGCKETASCAILYCLKYEYIHGCSRKQSVSLYHILGYSAFFCIDPRVQDVTSTIISPEPEPDSNNGLSELWLLWHWFACIALFTRYFAAQLVGKLRRRGQQVPGYNLNRLHKSSTNPVPLSAQDNRVTAPFAFMVLPH